MRDQLRLLAELQQLDSRLRALAIEKEGLPQQLHAYQQACHTVRDQLTSAQAQVEDTERRRRALEREIDTDNDRLAKAQSRLHEVKTNKEYSAVLAEIDAGKQRIVSLEDQVLELMEGAEQNQVTSQRCEQELEEATRELAEQERKVSEAQGVVSGHIATHGGEREALATRLQPELYTAYQRAAQRAGNTAAAVELTVSDETCGGCYLRVRPQLVSEVRKQESIVTCPHCKRILLWPEPTES